MTTVDPWFGTCKPRVSFEFRGFFPLTRRSVVALGIFLFYLQDRIYSGLASGCPFHFYQSWKDRRLNADSHESNVSRYAIEEYSGTNWGYDRLTRLESNWSENQTWQQKLKRVWEEIIVSPSKPNRYASLVELFFRLTLLGDDFTLLAKPLTFRPYSNTLKLLHSSSSYARVIFKWDDNDFRRNHTGIFSEPMAEAIVSASVGNAFVSNQSLAYGLAFKFFRSNVPSATILTLNAFFGRGASWNAFSYMTCNHISLAEMSVLLPTVPGWTVFPNQNGLLETALYNLEGEKHTSPRFPYALCFIPNSKLANSVGSPATFSHLSSLHSQFELVQPGDHLLDVVAIFHPRVLADPELISDPQIARHVGKVFALTTFTQSRFGDSRLFFQHAPFDTDLAARPDWIPYMSVRNLVKEGALGAYRLLNAPPKLYLSNQVIALQSLACALIRTLVALDVDGLRTIGIVGQQPSALDLLQVYLIQGGPIILRLAFPFHRSGGSETNLVASAFAERQPHLDEALLLTLQHKRHVVARWLMNLMPNLGIQSATPRRSKESQAKSEETKVEELIEKWRASRLATNATADTFHNILRNGSAYSGLRDPAESPSCTEGPDTDCSSRPRDRSSESVLPSDRKATSFNVFSCSPIPSQFRLNDEIVYRLLTDLSESRIFSPDNPLAHLLFFPRLTGPVDPKLIVMHLLEPLYYSLTAESSSRDVLFEKLVSAALNG